MNGRGPSGPRLLGASLIDWTGAGARDGASFQWGAGDANPLRHSGMKNHALNPFAGYPDSLTVHPGWSEFHYLLAALTSLLLLLVFFWIARWLDDRAI